METWKREEEEILREWSDKAMCFRWMHDRSHKLYRFRYACYTIPVIVLSTITGTANFAQDRVQPDYINYFVMLVGGLNIMAGVISTISQFLKISELNEGHRVASIAWGKFSRNLHVELARHPKDRISVKQFAKIAREEYDRLMETSPNIPSKIIKQFQKEVVEKLQKKGRTLILPDICGDLHETKIFHPEIENELEDSRKMDLNKQNFIQLNGRVPDEIELNQIIDKVVNRSSTSDSVDYI